MKMMLKNKRIAFPAIARPQSLGEGEPAYGGKLIIDPKDADVKRIDQAIREAAETKWKEDAEDVLAMLYEDKRVCFDKSPYRSKKTGKPYAGFEGMFNLGTRNAKTQPSVFDIYGDPVTDPNKIEALIYSGCYVHASVEFWAQDNTFGRRINCSLLGVMFAGDGESFGGGSAPATAEDFSNLARAKADADDIL